VGVSVARLRVACIAIGLACAVGAVACAGAPAPRETATLRVIATPPTARVYVEDVYVGNARVLAVRPATLRPGVRHVTIEAPGFFPHDVEVDLRAGETTVRIALRAVPP